MFVVIVNFFGLLSLYLLVLYGFVNRKQILFYFRQKGLSISMAFFSASLMIHVSAYLIDIQKNAFNTTHATDIGTQINNAVSDILPTFFISSASIAFLLGIIATVSVLLYLVSIRLGYKKLSNEVNDNEK